MYVPHLSESFLEYLHVAIQKVLVLGDLGGRRGEIGGGSK